MKKNWESVTSYSNCKEKKKGLNRKLCGISKTWSHSVTLRHCTMWGFYAMKAHLCQVKLQLPLNSLSCDGIKMWTMPSDLLCDDLCVWECVEIMNMIESSGHCSQNTRSYKLWFGFPDKNISFIEISCISYGQFCTHTRAHSHTHTLSLQH